MFNDVTTKYDLSDATWEIIIMLLVAFILGFLLRHFLSCCKKASCPTTAPVAETSGRSYDPDDLKIVEGIGPKIEGLLKNGGIPNLKQLAVADESNLKNILNEAGPRYQMHNPKTWSIQAELIVNGKWDDLKEYQDLLVGGKDFS